VLSAESSGESFGDLPSDILVLDRRLGEGDVVGAEAHLRRGGSVLVVQHPDDPCAEHLTGCRVVADLPETEWFVTLADRPEAVRLDGEVPVRTPLRLLGCRRDDVEVAATTSVRFRHEPTVTVRRVGAGRVVATGIGPLATALGHPTIGRFLRRVLAGAMPEGSRDVGVAVVGYGPFGGMGYLHGLAASETAGLRLAAAVDTVPERLEAARRDFGDVDAFASVDDLLAAGSADLVIIATPPVHHADLARRCLDAGVHVVVEKPMCLTVADADDLLGRAAAAGRVLSVHQSRRWDTDFVTLRRAVEGGLLGDVFNIETFVGGFEHPCRAWHSEESVSGGAVYDWGSHHIDWILQLYGSPPARVTCTAHTRVWLDTTNVDQLSVHMVWADGREATFRQSDLAAIRRPKFHVQGTRGTAEGRYRVLSADRLEAGRGYLFADHHHAEVPVDLTLVRAEDGFGLVESTLAPAAHPGWGFHRNLADHLHLGEPLAVRPEESREVVRVLEAAHRSGADGGSTIRL
jgi:predicted dehydrogenase